MGVNKLYRGRVMELKSEVKWEYDTAEQIITNDLIGGKLINKDKYGFSRTFEFTVDENNFKIVWFHNQSTLIINNLTHVMFFKAELSNTYPSHVGSKTQLQFRCLNGNCVAVIPVEWHNKEQNNG